MRVALVHDWLTGMRGGEKCLEVFCELFPDADLFALLHVKGAMSPPIEAMAIHTSFLQHVPGVGKCYRNFLPLFPRAIESFDLTGYDLVLSSSSCVAKGAKPGGAAVHVCYCHSPMRYIWDKFDDYFGPGRAPWHKRMAMKLCVNRLREWDVSSAARVHHFISNSRFVAERISRYYGRDAAVINPPVDCSRFQPSSTDGGYYLAAGAFVPYKRFDLAIEAFNRLGRPLKIAGGGPDEPRLRAMSGPSVEFMGKVNDEELAKLYAECRAFIFPGEEDFGIMPLEAMAAGRPVIALARGGALETVRDMNQHNDAATGVFFDEPSVDALCATVAEFEANAERFDKAAIRDHALTFDRPVYKQKINAFIEEKLPL